ncbi:DUF1028 domain-containing protein [Amycolatopsis jejuensis]|uniref:DUF1028 domain-containing protein n=1 Tax=Amycolatopsis jejuensis TaxID=330084 RepID=UPI00068B75EE|nr:DUF1028 domain-containing protein [Amycolatopsis jejuensis]
MTYTIAGWDPVEGQAGLATVSHSANVTAKVLAVRRAGPVTALVAAQAFSDRTLGERTAERFARGMAGPGVQPFRQVVGVTSEGRLLAWTGEWCVPVAAGFVDAAGGFAVAGNMLHDDGVLPAIADAFRRTHGDLAVRLLAAVQAGHAAGGDLRGDRSAGLVTSDLGGGRSAGLGTGDPRGGRSAGLGTGDPRGDGSAGLGTGDLRGGRSAGLGNGDLRGGRSAGLDTGDLRGDRSARLGTGDPRGDGPAGLDTGDLREGRSVRQVTGEVDLRVELDPDPVAALTRLYAVTTRHEARRACRDWIMADRPDRARARRLLRQLQGEGVDDPEGAAWQAVLQDAVGVRPSGGDLPGSPAQRLYAGFAAMAARWSDAGQP